MIELKPAVSNDRSDPVDEAMVPPPDGELFTIVGDSYRPW
jgi:hypothetical protein